MSEAPAGPRVTYQCVSCGKIFERERITRFAETQCPFCGYNVIKKARSQSAKLIKTSELGRDPSLTYFER
jgi:DNA-directed RNA polymerase subunit RPC12/RpoP